VSLVPDAEVGVGVTVVVPDDRSETVPYINEMLDVVPPPGFMSPDRVAVVFPIDDGARVFAVASPIGVNESMDPKLVPEEFVAFTLK
jgi:hypothetical protein